MVSRMSYYTIKVGYKTLIVVFDYMLLKTILMNFTTKNYTSRQIA